MKVLVTGASGMLGRQTAQRLAQQGRDVVVLQRRSADLDVTQELGDICDAATVARAVRGCDAVVHLAAKVSTVGPWQEFERVNVEGTQTLLDAAHEAGVSTFVYVSSPSVAHSGTSLVGASADPADVRHAHGNYARSKAMAEQLALQKNSAAMSVVAIRPHLVWGPGDQQLIERIRVRALSGRLVLINGGNALIDTTYVDNAVGALVAALDRAPTVGGEALVVSNGEPRTVRELLERICLALDVPAPSRSVNRAVAVTGGTVVEAAWAMRTAPDEPPLTRFLAEQLSTAHWFDQRRTRELLDWEPDVTLASGFARLSAAR